MKIRKAKIKAEIKEFVLIVFLFLYIFDVNLFPIEMVNLLTVFGLILFGIDCVQHKVLYVPTYVKNIVKYLMPFLCWLFLVEILHSIANISKTMIYISQFFSISLPFVRLIVAVYVIGVYLKFDTDKFESTIIKVGAIQCLCVVLAFINPEIRNAFNGLTLRNGHSTHMINYILTNNQRCYGLADNLFDSFGYITAIIIILTLITAINTNKKYFALFFPMLVMPLLNARTGLVLVAIGAVIVMFYYANNVFFKDIIKYIFLIVVGFIIISWAYGKLPADTREWIGNGITSISSLLAGEKTRTFSQLDQMKIYPDNNLLGDGASAEILNKGASDIGYIRILWQTGIIGVIIYVGSLVLLFLRCYKKTNLKKRRCFIACLAVIYFVYLYKLYSLGNAGANCLIFGFLVLIEKDNYIISREEIVGQ